MKNAVLLKIIIVTFLSVTGILKAQTISKPTLKFSQACASQSFNTFRLEFTIDFDSSLTDLNEFVIELSDSSGGFANTTDIFPIKIEPITPSQGELTFSFPETTSGERYKVRVKSISLGITGSVSNAFAAYFKLHDTPFSINNLIETGLYCSGGGGGYLLTIDNPGSDPNDSPLKYASLTFNWFRVTGPTTSQFIETSPTYLVTEPGTYFAETNYGTCTSNSFSNRVTVSEATTTGIISSISSSLGNPYCAAEGETILSTISGGLYQWFKEGNEIEGATSETYVTNETGNYSVNIDLGGCTSSASIVLETSDFDSSIDVLDINTIEEEESLLATVTTSAVEPEFKWFFNDIEIPGETNSSFEAAEAGSYKVTIEETVGCVFSQEYLFEVEKAIDLFPDVSDIPNLISPNNDGTNDTWVIPKEYVSGTNTEVLIINAQGKIIFETNDYQNNWPIDQISFISINPVYYYVITTENNQIKKGSITVIR